MTTFTIETETNNITAHATTEDAKAVLNSEYFGSAEQLAELAADWPTARLIEIWNSIPGVSPVKKFTYRKAAATRIWKAIQPLGESILAETATESKPAAEEATELVAAPGPLTETADTELTRNIATDEEQPMLDGSNQRVATPADKDVHAKYETDEFNGNASAQSPDVAVLAEEASKNATRQKKRPRANQSRKRRGREARPQRSSN